MSVSVIVPAYNRAALLPLTLDAIFAQTRPPDEVIVVDDGSTDGTAAAARRPGVCCMTIANSGDLAARNVGLRAARGDLVAFCDSDDLWRPEFLATMLAVWQAEPRTRAAFCDFVAIRDGVWGEETKFATAPPGYWDGLRAVGPDSYVFDTPVVDRLIRFQPLFPSCLVAEQKFLVAVGGWDESVGRTVGSDFATALRLAEHPPLGIVRRALVGIRRHPGNFSADVQAVNLGDARILAHLLASRPSLLPLAPMIRASIERRRREALDTAFARRDFAAVREIAALLERPAPLAAVKRRVAALPEPLRGVCSGALLALGSARAKKPGPRQA
jgi:glycosyltransferase involved in cell wall biosynthesis